MFTYRSLAADDPKILEHLLAMTPEDRRCRFHGVTSDARIAQHCAEMAQREGQLIGCSEGERLIGLIEIVICRDAGDRYGEVGMSVAADRRGRGIGRSLVEHALDYAANRGLRLVFGYLPDNTRIPRIVLDLGGHVDRLGTTAELPPRPPTPFSLFLAALDDAALMAAKLTEFWRQALGTASDLRGASPHVLGFTIAATDLANPCSTSSIVVDPP